jgi:hypothetical protein
LCTNLSQEISGKCPIGSIYLSGLLPTFQNFIKEAIDANVDERPEKNPEIIQCAVWKRQMQEAVQQDYPHLTPEEVTEIISLRCTVLFSNPNI